MEGLAIVFARVGVAIVGPVILGNDLGVAAVIAIEDPSACWKIRDVASVIGLPLHSQVGRSRSLGLVLTRYEAAGQCDQRIASDPIKECVRPKGRKQNGTTEYHDGSAAA